VLVVSALADNAASSLRRRASAAGRAHPGRQRLQQPGLHQERRRRREGVNGGHLWNSLSQDPANQKFLAAMKKAGVNPTSSPPRRTPG